MSNKEVATPLTGVPLLAWNYLRAHNKLVKEIAKRDKQLSLIETYSRKSHNPRFEGMTVEEIRLNKRFGAVTHASLGATGIATIGTALTALGPTGDALTLGLAVAAGGASVSTGAAMVFNRGIGRSAKKELKARARHPFLKPKQLEQLGHLEQKVERAREQSEQAWQMLVPELGDAVHGDVDRHLVASEIVLAAKDKLGETEIGHDIGLSQSIGISRF